MYDEKTIRVYQAYSNTIADEAVRLGTFGTSFKLTRMTWIKPSFLWMMYRSGWGTKEGQERILAIDMKREGFDYIVNNSVISSFHKEIHGTHEEWKRMLEKSDIRCQWDPDRDIYGSPQKQRTIQLGIKGKISKSYVHDWITKITDITHEVNAIREAMKTNRDVYNILPSEIEYHTE